MCIGAHLHASGFGFAPYYHGVLVDYCSRISFHDLNAPALIVYLEVEVLFYLTSLYHAEIEITARHSKGERI